MTYSYDRRVIAFDADNGLRNLGSLLFRLADEGRKYLADLENPEKARMVPHRIAALVKSTLEASLRLGVYGLFLEILKTYSLSPKDRKVVERASKFFGKNSVRRVAPDKAVEALSKVGLELKEYYEVAKRILESGTKHEEGDNSATVLKAGPFTLVNTGGFDAKTMDTTVKVVEKASQLISKKGFSKVCYGPVQVTNTVARSTRTLAFYMVNDDSLYLRANLKGQVGPALHSVLHELGHRLQFQFLKSKKSEIDALYRRLQGKKEDLRRDPANWPDIGSEIQLKNQTVIVVKVYPVGNQISVALKDDPNVKGSIALEPFLKDPGKTSFVSGYAEKDPDENFAEMFSHYCLDTLSEDQVAMLEAIIR